MSKMKLKIGEFSQMMQVTVKTLRHYEQKGLLLPDEVDEWTGYRYYTRRLALQHDAPQFLLPRRLPHGGGNQVAC